MEGNCEKMNAGGTAGKELEVELVNVILQGL